VNIDTVILAGGRGTRLRGVTPTYFKPLLVVDGTAMIVHVIRRATSVTSGKIVIVLAPDNVAPITSLIRDSGLLDDQLRFVVQPEPTGPGDAFLIAAEMCQTKHVLILAADNLFGENDLRNVIQGLANDPAPNLIVGGKKIADPEVAQRFTRITADGSFEGPIKNEIDESWGDSFYVWLGPLIVDRVKMSYILRSVNHAEGGERKIGPHLWRLTDKINQGVKVDCDTHDVGDLNGG
jgi:NDP-sugar pyrophosphorylase family protein